MNEPAKARPVTNILGKPQDGQGQTHHQLLNIDQISPYDRNPRRAKNPRYDDIKAAIQASGRLNNPLSVTRRPGATHYMVESGGNTRLQILQELWQETHDATFYKTDCLVVPWQSESHVLSAHLIENELRGDSILIDKAVALRSLKIELEKEIGKPLSRNEFSKELARSGLPISPRQLTRFNYAADVLEPLIPVALNAGLGNDKVDQLRKIQAGYGKCLIGFGNTQHFEPLFAQALAGHDGEELDIDAIQRTLDDYIVGCTGQPLNRVRLQVDSLLLEAQGEQEPAAVPLDRPFLPPGHPRDNGANVAPKAAPPGNGGQDMTFQRLQAEQQGKADQQPPVISNPTDSTATTNTAPLKLGDLPLLRSQCYGLAQQLAGEMALPRTVMPWGQGYGFYMDLPAHPIQDEMAYYTFWMLVGLSGQHLSTERIKLAQEMRFARLILADQTRNAYETIGSPAQLDHFGAKVLLSKRLPEEALSTLFQLARRCRQVSLTYRESDIFECMTVEQTQLRDHMAKAAAHHHNVDGGNHE